jgi:Protein of unknown function (DUF4019)
VTRAFCLLFALTVTVSDCSASADIHLAERGVIRFHELLDAGRYTQIFEQSSDDLKKASTQSAVVALLEAAHRKLGNTKSAVNQGWNFKYHTSGTIITLTYKTVFSEGEATEQFVFRIQGNTAALVDYHIQESRSRDGTNSGLTAHEEERKSGRQPFVRDESVGTAAAGPAVVASVERGSLGQVIPPLSGAKSAIQLEELAV